MGKRLVIVGAGMATGYLLQELAAHDNDLQITVIGEEAQACYNRVLLSGVLAGENSEAELDMLDAPGLCAGVQFVLDTRVEQVQLRARTVTTSHGQTVPYDLLVFATGATVARPAIETGALSGVEDMRTLADVERLKNLVREGERAVVVGGGLLGLEAAHGLNALGFSTTVLHRQAWLMNRQLDREGGELLQRKLEDQGIDFRLQTSVAHVHPSGGDLGALGLLDGSSMACDLLVFASGITPVIGLAQSAGIATERGVLIDEYMRTSDRHCYALGECSQLGRQCFGLVAPIRMQAAVLARQLVDMGGEGFALEDWPAQLKISGIEIFSAGPVDAAGETLVLRDSGRGVYRRLVLEQGRLKSAVLVGDKRDGIWYQELISSGKDVSAVRRQLMFGRKICDAVEPAAEAA